MLAQNDDFISVGQLSEDLGMNKGNLFKLLEKLNIDTYKKRDITKNNQTISVVTKQDYEFVKNYRSDYGVKETSDIEDGYFYLVLPIPTLDETRFKLGFTSDIGQRLASYKTICPEAKMLKKWPCKKFMEKTIMHMVTHYDCDQIGIEIFKTDSIDKIVDRLNMVFRMVDSTCN